MEKQNLIDESDESIDRIEREIRKLDETIDFLKSETVKDKVYGGYGGTQSFVIEGFPSAEYNKKCLKLREKQRRLAELKEVKEQQNESLQIEVDEIEKYISEIKDPHILRIIEYKVVKGMSWNETAMKIGGHNTADSVRMCLKRYIEK